MSKFTVNVYTTYTVEAEDSDDACDKVFDIIASTQGETAAKQYAYETADNLI